MAVVTLCSAAGAPGVTTTAVALAMNWPRPVLLVEADPRGTNGLLAGLFRGQREYESGLLDLAASPLAMYDALRDAVRPLADDSTVRYLVGTQSHTQAAGLRDLWAPLGEELADLERTGQDVIVDAGVLGFPGSPEPLLAWADLTVLVTRSHLPALSAARPWVEHLATGSGWRQPGLLLIGAGHPYSATEVRKALGLPVVADVVDDPASAAVYHRGSPAPRRFESGGYLRSIRTTVQAVTGAVATFRDELVRDVKP